MPFSSQTCHGSMIGRLIKLCSNSVIKDLCRRLHIAEFTLQTVTKTCNYCYKPVVLKPCPARPSGAAREAIFIGKKT